MFIIERNGTNRLDIELGGKLDSDAVRSALDELLDKASSIENGRMLYRIGNFDFPSFGAIGVELSRLPGLFRLIGHFDKVAVVANQQWIRAVSEFEGAFIPGLAIKAFAPDQIDEAEFWLAAVD